ncbi:MAG: DUF5777 family beta-barrel protein [Bacteroidota bacterium]|nr:DUF5777 family beta-barrel protein [Bacteroidota bacterium]
MKTKYNLLFVTMAFCGFLMTSLKSVAQDSTKVASSSSTKVDSTDSAKSESADAAPAVKRKSFVKETFEGDYLIDNQTVMVPVKGSFVFTMQHRFGVVSNGFTDLFGIFANATVRLGFSYVPVKNLQIGFGITSNRMQADWDIKYALLKQTKDNGMPVSVSYFGNAVMDTRKRDATTLFVSASDRFSFFNQIMIARKFSDKLSIQVSPSLSHFNNLAGYLDSSGKVQPLMKNNFFAISFSGRYKISPQSSIIVNYDQPLTQNPANNPHPNISIGLEVRTSGHDFQFFAGNYAAVLPQNDIMYNQNDYTKGQFLIGFNITRLWNF